MIVDVVVVGGGPGGLSAAFTLGRSCKRVLLCDSGPRRNAAADQIHNFVTQDGTSPEEFRQIARQQLAKYPNVQVRDLRVESISGEKGAFQVALSSGSVESRRVLLCTGMIDEGLELEGFRELWGSAIFQCPYCHGWEVRNRNWGYLVRATHAHMLLPFALQARAWTRDLTVFTDGEADIPEELRSQLDAAGIQLVTDPVQRLVAKENRLEAVELSDGTKISCEVLFTHPPQRQVELVVALGLALNDDGYVQVDEARSETSVPGIYAAGDLTTQMQGAVLSAAANVRAAAMINVELTMELASSGAL